MIFGIFWVSLRHSPLVTRWGNAQRYYSVRDEKSAYRVGMLAFLLFLLSPLLFGIPPLVGKVLWPDVSLIGTFFPYRQADENIFIAVVMRLCLPVW
jgi:hypothetical protein